MNLNHPLSAHGATLPSIFIIIIPSIAGTIGFYTSFAFITQIYQSVHPD